MEVWTTSSVIVLVGVLVAAGGLGWFAARRRHPAYVLAFGLVLLGIAGLTVITLPTVMLGWSAPGLEEAFRAGLLLPRITGVVAGGAVAYSLVAGVTVLLASDGAAAEHGRAERAGGGSVAPRSSADRSR